MLAPVGPSTFHSAPVARPQATATAAVSGTPSVAEHVELGHLSWGIDPSTRQPWTPAALKAAMATNPALARDVNAMLKLAKATVGTPLPPIAHIYSEGLLANNPLKVKTGKTLKRFDEVTAWAFAARMAPSPLREQATRAITTTLMSWAQTYKPSGNPINENKFLSFFQAADLALPLMSKHQQGVVRGWLHSFVKTSEAVHLPGGENINNWRSFNLEIRASAAAVLGDHAAIARVSHTLDALLARTISADGSSYDFHDRDALHYHVYNLSALLSLATTCPQAVSAASRHRIEKSVQFLAPYYLGKKKHLEFVHTHVAFDLARRRNGEPAYQIHVWNPREADTVLQQARALFPSVRAWSGRAEAGGMGARNELTTTLRWPGRG